MQLEELHVGVLHYSHMQRGKVNVTATTFVV